MRVYRPIKTNKITQNFGDNEACVLVGSRSTIAKKIHGICPPGYEDFYTTRLNLKGHNGTDMAAWHGEPVYFPVITEEPIEWYALDATDASGGIGVDVISKDSINGIFYKFRFWHFLREVVSDDQPIKAGELIGYADSTGASSGDHVHFEMKLCDENGNTLNRDNGYAGAVPLGTFYEDKFILDVLGEGISSSHIVRSFIKGFMG